MTGVDDKTGELAVFVRFRAVAGREAEVAALIRKVLSPSRAEAGNVSIHAFRSIRDEREFYIHSLWRDEAAFDLHAELPHTLRFIHAVAPLLDHELRVARTRLMACGQGE